MPGTGIIAMLNRREEGAIREMDIQYGALLKRVIGRILPDPEDAEECLNDTYLKANAQSQGTKSYGAIVDLKRSGALTPKRKAPTDYLVALASRSMEERVRLRRIRQELLNDFKESALGMMENIQEVQKNVEQRWNRVSDEIQRDMEAQNGGEDPWEKAWEQMKREASRKG